MVIHTFVFHYALKLCLHVVCIFQYNMRSDIPSSQAEVVRK